MEIKFLGTGGAFDFEKGTAAAVVSVAGKNILLDCGFSTILKLAEKDYFEKIDYILITHLHNDHVGSLPTLLAYYKHKLKVEMPKIIVPSESFTNELRQLLSLSAEKDWASYVSISDFPELGFVDTTGQHIPEMTSFAYYFVEEEHLIYYSGDIANADTAKTFLESRGENNIQVFHGVAPFKQSAIHTPYTEIEEKLADYEVYVYHVAKENMPADSTLKLVEDCPEFLL